MLLSVLSVTTVNALTKTPYQTARAHYTQKNALVDLNYSMSSMTFFNKYININKVTYMHNYCLDMILFKIEELNIPGLSFESKLLYCST